MEKPVIAVVAAGAMGSAVGRRLVDAGCTVLTTLEGRSEATRRRARDAGMEDTSLVDISQRAGWVLSIVPPKDALSFAQQFADALAKTARSPKNARLVFADCNAVSPHTVKTIGAVFQGTAVSFVDGCIIGGPPSDGYDPTFYASVAQGNEPILENFVALSQFGLKIQPLRGENSGIGDASALKMSYAGISKGTTGLLTTMILAAHASSPATAQALMHELFGSQPMMLRRITQSVPAMLPKAYRWVAEMEEIADFIGGAEGDTYRGLAKLYQRVEKAVNSDEPGGDMDVLNDFVKDAKVLLEKS